MINPSNRSSDYDLFSKLRTENSLQAFDLLFERYWHKLYRVAYAGLKDEQDAQDCVQELFVTIWTKKLEPIENLSVQAYLSRAVKNRVYNQLYARRIRDRHHHLYVRELNSGQINYTGRLEEEELTCIIQAVITHMPEQMRKVYLLSRDENLSGIEIAARLRLSHQTVRNQISNALKRIRERIDDYQSIKISSSRCSYRDLAGG
jgi:RNA polymerase sigma-70 factor (family 1)